MHPLIEKTRDDYDAIAPYFAETRQQAGPDLTQFKSFITSGQRILDWGCGNGRLLYLLRDQLGSLATSGLDYYGLDQSAQLLKIARQAFRHDIQQGQVHFFCTAQRSKKFPPDFFDLIL